MFQQLKKKKKAYAAGKKTTLLISNYELNVTGVTKTIKNERKGQKRGFLGMLLGTLGASLPGNMLAGKGMLRAG